MQNNRVLKFHARCRENSKSLDARISEFPDLPVMPETLLCMELSNHAPTVNLGDLADLVLSDLGATVQIMRAANRECDSPDGRFHRIEDCISSLGVEACVDAVSGEASIRGGESLEIRNAWLHARDIAWKMKSIAEGADSGVKSSEAFVVGLLHEIDQVPRLMLRNSLIGSESDSGHSGFELARAWSLPECVCEYFLEGCDASTGKRWSRLVERAHGIQNVISFKSEPAAEVPAVLLKGESIRPATI